MAILAVLGTHWLRRVSYLSPYKNPAPTAVAPGGLAGRYTGILLDLLALKKVNSLRNKRQAQFCAVYIIS